MLIAAFFVRIKQFFKSIFGGAWQWGDKLGAPLALLFLCFVSFGLLIPWLGFYWDDWPVLLTSRLFGPDALWKFYQYDRPASAWTYIVTLPVLGYNAWAWQMFSLLLRWATAVMVWLTVRGTWPERRREAAWVAFLFAVYPVFSQQLISVAYSQHWLSYLFLMFSLAAMVWAARRPQAFWWLTIPALIAEVLHTITMEYFMLLELLRPLLLWMVYRSMTAERADSKAPSTRQMSLFFYKHWLPYGLLLVLTLVWRFLYIKFPGGEQPNPPILLYQMLQNPLQGIERLVQIALQDVVFVLVSVWEQRIDPTLIDYFDRFNLFALVVAVVSALAAVFLLSPWRRETRQPPLKARHGWVYYALVLGVIALLLGILPVWVTDRQIIRGSHSDRFVLAGMFGASLVVVAVLEWLTAYRVQKALVLVALISIAVGAHLRTANDYRWGWVKQSRFYWQLAWRAPAILPDTAIFSDGEIFPYVGLYSTSAAINLIYPNPAPGEVLPYYFYSLGRSYTHQIPAFLAGIPAEKPDFRNYTFQGNTRDGLVIHYDPTVNDCLHVLSPEDGDIPDLPEITREAVENANLGRIQAGPIPAGYPPVEIFGAEPERGWCYFFQKADLARQMGDWNQAAALGDEAIQQGYAVIRSESDTPYEWLPFIEAYARVGRWQEAERIAQDIVAEAPGIDASLCRLWARIGNDAQTAQVNRQKSRMLLAQYGCQ